MQQKEINYQGKRLFYRLQGEGPVVMLVHGFGEDGTVWKNQYDIFPNNKLIVPDLPGSGMSEMIEDMSMEGLAEALREILIVENKPGVYPKPIIEGDAKLGVPSAGNSLLGGWG